MRRRMQLTPTNSGSLLVVLSALAGPALAIAADTTGIFRCVASQVLLSRQDEDPPRKIHCFAGKDANLGYCRQFDLEKAGLHATSTHFILDFSNSPEPIYSNNAKIFERSFVINRADGRFVSTQIEVFYKLPNIRLRSVVTGFCRDLPQSDDREILAGMTN